MKKIINMTLVILIFSSYSYTQDQRKFDFPRRNSVYLQNLVDFPALYFDRIIPISDHFGVIPKLGIVGFYGTVCPGFETSIFVGGNKHYGEIGAGKWPDLNVGVIILNYRYIGEKGLLIKVGFTAVDNSLFPAAGIGYSF